MDIEIKSVVYGMKILSGVLQLGGLVIASRIDLRVKEVEIAEDKIPADEWANMYRASVDEVPYIQSKEAALHGFLESRNDPAKNALLFKRSIWMVGSGMLIQLVADIVES